MKKIFFVITLLAGTGYASFAQTGSGMQPQDQGQTNDNANHQMPTPEQRAQKQTDRMDRFLNLSTEQKQRVYEINLNTTNQMLAMKQNGQKGMGKTIMEQRDSQLRTILTDEQYQKMKQYQEAKKDKMQQRHQQPLQDNSSLQH